MSTKPTLKEFRLFFKDKDGPETVSFLADAWSAKHATVRGHILAAERGWKFLRHEAADKPKRKKRHER